VRPPTGAPAGWYPDPSGALAQRYYDGYRWTDRVEGRFRPDRPPVPTLDVRAAIGAAAVLLVSLLVSRFLLEWLVEFGWPIAAYAAISAAVGYGPSLLWCVYAARRWGTGGFTEVTGLRVRWSDIGWGPLVWVTAVIAEVVAVTVILAFDVPLTGNTEGISELRADRTYVVSLLVTAVVAAPIVEELVFRGVMLRGLGSRLPVAVAVIVQGAVFGLAHVDPVRGRGNVGLVLVLMTVGVVFGGAAHLLRRLGPTVIAHAILNGVVMAVVLLG
jgi:membrane protease YdiL (CAAX protease family)